MNLFYSDLDYRKRQSEISKNNWQKGLYSTLVKPLEIRKCKNKNCSDLFSVKPYDPKVFCSRNCAASVNNTGRIQSEETRKKISSVAQKQMSRFKGIEKVKRVRKICLYCKREFKILPYLVKRRKFCSNKCAMQVIGKLTTSPKASKGKSGIRLDIDSTICFYSTWEANVARVFNLVGIVWQYSPKIFDLGRHTYRPDFYLPKDNKYIEVKNFMNKYSFERDKLFRQKFPYIKLEVLSKDKYSEIEANYKPLIDSWEG